MKLIFNIIFAFLLLLSFTLASDEIPSYTITLNIRIIEKAAHNAINEVIKESLANHSQLIEINKIVTNALKEKDREVLFTEMKLDDQAYQNLQGLCPSPPQEDNSDFSFLEVMPAFEEHIEKYKNTLKAMEKSYFKENIKTVWGKIAGKKNNNIKGYQKQLSSALHTYEILRKVIEKIEEDKNFCQAVAFFKSNLFLCKSIGDLLCQINKEELLVCSISTWFSLPSSHGPRILYDEQAFPGTQQSLFKKIKALTYNNTLRACQIIIKYFYSFYSELEKEEIHIKTPVFEAFGTIFHRSSSLFGSSLPSYPSQSSLFKFHPRYDAFEWDI